MEDGTTTNVPGYLLRTVIEEPNPEGAPIRKITFRLSYTYLSHSYSVQMVTEHAIDD